MGKRSAYVLFYVWDRPLKWWHYPMRVVTPRYSHVAVAFGRFVYSPKPDGCTIHPIECLGRPRAAVEFSVESLDPADLMDGFGVLPSFLKWATFGLWPGRNCVTVIVDCLRKSGIDAPRRITTPDQLFDWATGD